MTECKIRIIFLLPSLSPGGAQRVISFVAQNINKAKFEPTLLIAGFEQQFSYKVDKVNVVYLNKSRILSAIPSIIRFFIKTKPNIVVSSISHVNRAMAIIAPAFKNIWFIGREATILSKRKIEDKSKKWSPLHIIPYSLKNLDMVICQSKDMAQDMIDNYQIPEEKICIINNPISNLNILKESNSVSSIKRFITVGRLAEVKGHYRILDILSKLRIPFEYTIIGDGELKDEIFRRAEVLGIRKYIKHVSFTNEIEEYLADNDMFLQGSFVEGFPNALLESCVVGTPVIAFDVPGGTKEIIKEGVNGHLVDTSESFLEKLEMVRIWNPQDVRKSVIDSFSKEKIISQYEQLFLKIVKGDS